MRWGVAAAAVVVVVAAAAAVAEVEVFRAMNPIVRAAEISCCAGVASIVKSRRNWKLAHLDSRWGSSLLLLCKKNSNQNLTDRLDRKIVNNLEFNGSRNQTRIK